MTTKYTADDDVSDDELDEVERVKRIKRRREADRAIKEFEQQEKTRWANTYPNTLQYEKLNNKRSRTPKECYLNNRLCRLCHVELFPQWKITGAPVLTGAHDFQQCETDVSIYHSTTLELRKSDDGTTLEFWERDGKRRKVAELRNLIT